MKKLLLSIFTVIIFSFCLIFSVSATETEAQENVDIIIDTETNVDAEAPSDETTEPSTPEENTKEIVDYAINVLTSSSFWTALATVLAGTVTMVVLMVRSFSGIKTLIKGKADAKTIRTEIQGGVTEIGNQFTFTIAQLKDELGVVKTELENEKFNSKQLAVMLATFILHSKIGTSAKGEIMKIFNGIKEYTGTAQEVVNQIEDAIAIAEKEAEKEETPALDEVISLSLN
jgi:hypothetical protein